VNDNENDNIDPGPMPGHARFRVIEKKKTLRLCGICLRHHNRCPESIRSWLNSRERNWKRFRKTRWKSAA
jgi:hypothetical protein